MKIICCFIAVAFTLLVDSAKSMEVVGDNDNTNADNPNISYIVSRITRSSHMQGSMISTELELLDKAVSKGYTPARLALADRIFHETTRVDAKKIWNGEYSIEKLFVLDGKGACTVCSRLLGKLVARNYLDLLGIRKSINFLDVGNYLNSFLSFFGNFAGVENREVEVENRELAIFAEVKNREAWCKIGF
jgi:hypothetical protein